MSAQRTVHTNPETLIRRELHRRGLRFRVNYPVPSRPRRTMDVAFTRYVLAVFVDGCFWHVCPLHATWPVANSAWWRNKLEANRSRDLDTDLALRSQGWDVVRIWEHEDVLTATDRIVEALECRRACKD